VRASPSTAAAFPCRPMPCGNAAHGWRGNIVSAVRSSSRKCTAGGNTRYAMQKAPGKGFDNRVSATLFPVPNIDEMSGDRGSGGHRGRHKMSPSLVSLAAFEIAVRSRRAPLAGRKLVRIHRKAHRAAWLAPLESGSFENLVETFRFRLHFYQA